MYYGFRAKTIEVEDTEKEITYSGLVQGRNYVEAMSTLFQDYFNEDEVLEIHLEYITDNSIVLMPSEFIKTIKEKNNI